MIVIMGMLACIAFPLIIARPEYGAYLILLANPLIVGIARGQLGYVFRPNELLLIYILSALCVRGLLSIHRRPRPDRAWADPQDAAILMLIVAGSVAPVLWRYVRGLGLSEDDLLYAAVLPKYYVLYRVFRSAITTPAQVETCLRLTMVSGLVVAIIGFLQVRDLFGIPEFLSTHYDQPFEGHPLEVTDRATSTVASAFGLADMMIMSGIIGLALSRTFRTSRLLLFTAVVLLSGCIAAGEFSCYIGLAVALCVFGLMSGNLQRLVPVGVVGAGLAALVFRSVVETRLEGFQDQAGMPASWMGRVANLQTYFLPELLSHDNWILGVRPAPRLPALETWRDWVYIESGYVWLLWIGGLPFVAAFVFFAIVSFKSLRRTVQERTDAVGVGALAGLSYLIALLVMMLFDPHLTLRGSADLFFPLLALSTVPLEFPIEVDRLYRRQVAVTSREISLLVEAYRD